MYGSGAVSCSCSLLIRGPILPAVRQKLHLSPCADSQSRLLDCSIVEGWAFEIIKQPEHGTAEIVPTTAFPTYPKENPRHKCNEHKIDALMLTYKPNTGYKGPDSFTYVEIAPSGYAFEKTYRFNVRAIPATTTGPKQRGAVLRSSFRYLA